MTAQDNINPAQVKKMPRGALKEGTWVKCWGCKRNIPREDAYMNPHAPVLGAGHQCKDSVSCSAEREKAYS